MAFPGIAKEAARTVPAVALDGKPRGYSTLARIGRGDVEVAAAAEGLERVHRGRVAFEAAPAIRANSALAGQTGCSETLIRGCLDLLNWGVAPAAPFRRIHHGV
jgi:hypothetical protein